MSTAAVRRGEVLSWLKVGGIVLPMLVAVVVAAAKLSSDATELRRDVTELDARVEKLSTIDARLERLSLQVTALDERIQAQNANVARFWSVTWPGLESRLARIEAALERR